MDHWWFDQIPHHSINSITSSSMARLRSRGVRRRANCSSVPCATDRTRTRGSFRGKINIFPKNKNDMRWGAEVGSFRSLDFNMDLYGFYMDFMVVSVVKHHSSNGEVVSSQVPIMVQLGTCSRSLGLSHLLFGQLWRPWSNRSLVMDRKRSKSLVVNGSCACSSPWKMVSEVLSHVSLRKHKVSSFPLQFMPTSQHY